MVKITDKLKQRFCKDQKLPIQIYTSPYFEERLKLMNKLDTYIDFIMFINNTFETTEDYFEYYNNLKDTMINYIKDSEAYKLLQTEDMNKYSRKHALRQSDVYKESNIGKTFFSIDMQKANFSALVKFGKNTNTKFFDSFNYDDFIKSFTHHNYFKSSKYIRQVIFGNCNPKRQVTYESYLMDNLLEELISNNIISIDDIYSLCSDEIIIEVKNENTSVDIIRLIEFCNSFTEFPIKTEYFKLGKIVNTNAYIKESIFNGSYSLKCVNALEAPFIYRFLNDNGAYKDSDLVFIHEGKLAKFLECPKLKITYNKNDL